MFTRLAAPVLLLLVAPLRADAAVVLIANYTNVELEFSVAEPDAKARPYKIGENQLQTVFVTGPADITFSVKGGREAKLRLDPYNAYVFIPDRVTGLRLEGVELPGKALERDGKPEINPVPRDPPVKVPVTLLVDDCDPRADKLWQAEVRKRFDEAAEVIEKATSIRLEFAGFDTWKSDPNAANVSELLTGFENAVKVKEGSLAVGWSSRKIDEKMDPAFGVNRGIGGRHILLREWRPKAEAERTEVLAHFLAQALGGVGTPDPGSALRAKLGDGYLNRPGSVLRLDPLNALALNLWADERRRDPGVTITTLSVVNRHRLTRIYKALLEATPGDALAIAYLNDLGGDLAKDPNPMPKKLERPRVMTAARDELVRKVVKAVTETAKRNAAQGEKALTGDELTALYIKAAAQAAENGKGPEMVSAFLIALGVAFDETGALADDPATAGAVEGAESTEDRKARLAALGNPTLGGRRDLCRRFFLGCAVGEVLAADAAENAAVTRAMLDLSKPVGLCVPALAAEFAGIAFARTTQNDPEVLRDVMQKFTAADYLPPLTGLRNGLTAEKFKEVYGDEKDERFLAVPADIRKRVKAMRAYR